MQKKSVGTREISQTQKSPGNAEALKVVGEEGFEPPTLWSQTRCATKLRYSPRINGVANETRTRDNRNHNPGLYQLSYSHH